MEVLFISHKYPPTIGGMEKQCFELIANVEKHHKVHQIVFTGEEESKFSFFFKLRSRVKKLLKQHPTIDIIHLNDGLMGLFSTWLNAYTKIPVVVTFHGLDLVFPNPLYQKRIKNKFSHYDGVICVSTATANECIARDFDKEKVFVVPNGVDHDLANFKVDKTETIQYIKENYGIDISNKKLITTLGRSVKRKGFSWYLENVADKLDDDIVTLMVGPVKPPKKKSLIKRIIPKVVTDRIELLYGGVNDEAAVRALMQTDKLKGKVIQTGKLPFDKLLSVLSLSDIFAMPNIAMEGDMEGFGLVALEASLCKAVVYASNIDGIPEAIQDKKNGFLLPSGDAEHWVKTLNNDLANPTELNENGQAFKDFTLNNYGWEKMAQCYVDVFEQLIAKKG